jgi:predicted NAD/FAD-binding protein
MGRKMGLSPETPMRIAVIGAGVAGLAAAARLHPHHDITVYEAESHLGGHALTRLVDDSALVASLARPDGLGRRGHDPRTGPRPTEHAADLGFMVWNRHTYPGLTALFERLGTATAPTSMGFSVRDARSGLEYAGETLNGLFAQRRNLVRPSFLAMIAAILRFNRHARDWVAGPHADATLGELLERERLPRAFRDHYLIPMGAAIWSASERDMDAFPAAFFVRFLANHGMLEPPSRQFRWRVVTGGSRHYVAALVRPFADRARTGCPVRRVERTADGVTVTTDAGTESFDRAVLALHADQALAVLADATPLEREALSAFPYRTNDAVLHTDTALLPRARAAWASWNYHVPAERGAPVMVTYDLSRLQHLATPGPLLLTLNDGGRVAEGRVVERRVFAHPAFTRASIAMQERHAEVDGTHRVHFCGAYWRNGFHEDGFASGETVAARILALDAGRA